MWPFACEGDPKFPKFSSGRRLSLELPSIKLSFSAPPSNVMFGEIVEDAVVVSDFSKFNFVPTVLKGKEFPLMYCRLYSGTWAVKGAPLVSPKVGQVSCQISVLKSHASPVNESCFTPECFIDLIRKEAEIRTSNDTFEYMDCPEGFSLFAEELANKLGGFDMASYNAARAVYIVNSQWCQLEGVLCFYCEDFQTLKTDHCCRWLIPIADDYYVSIVFRFWRLVSNAGNYYRASKRVPLLPFRQAVSEFMSGFRLELGPELSKKMVELSDALEASNPPRVEPSPNFVFNVKWALKKASSIEYASKDGNNGEISAREASDFVDDLMKPRSIPGSYGFDGPVTYVHHQGDLSPVPLSFRKEVPPP